MFKKLFFIFLFVNMIFTVYSFNGSGNGTSIDPYEITNCFELQEMENDLFADYILMNDVDCSVISNFSRVGYCIGQCNVPGDGADNSFRGNFDGKNFTIYNLRIFISSYVGTGWGLFGRVEGGTLISNVKLVDVDINVSENTYVGALVGKLDSSTVVNSKSSGVLSGSNYVGGLVGGASGNPFFAYVYNIYNSSSSVDVFGNFGVGGLVGYIYSVFGVFDSYSTGEVTGNESTGGFVGGIFQGKIENSYSKGNVVGNDGVGGFIGSGSSGYIYNSFSTSDVTGFNVSTTGGFIGSSGFNIYNSSWYNSSENPSIALGTDSNAQVVFSNSSLDYFYNSSNSPMDLWSTSIWNFTGSDLPFHIWDVQNDVLVPLGNSSGLSSVSLPSFGFWSSVVVFGLIGLFLI
jgi:hypothetical protein